MAVTDEDLKAITDAIAATKEPAGQTWIKNAGEALGLVAGFVAFAYLVGGTVIGLRLLLDRFSLQESVGVIAELPREFVVTAGLVEALAAAALVGVIAALIAIIINRPDENDCNKEIWDPPILVITFAVITLGIPYVVGFIVLGDRMPEALWLLPAPVLTFCSLCAGWYLLRRAGGLVRYRMSRAALAGLVWTGIAVTPGIVAASFLGFEDARICIRDGGGQLTGGLIASSDSRVLLIRLEEAERTDDTPRTVDSIPADRVERLDHGDITGLPPCPTG